MPKKVIIHIGLHKTATRFLQRDLFASLDKDNFIYNPDELRNYLTRLIKEPGNQNFLDEAKRLTAKLTNDHKTLVISMPDLSGDMFDNHRRYKNNLEFLKKLFPEAEIIYFVRNHSDWLLSAYKQSLNKGKPGPVEVFLNYYDGQFKDKYAARAGGMRNLEALKLDFLNIYQAYSREYGPDYVHLFRYEDFRYNKEAVMSSLKNCLGLKNLPSLNAKKVRNRAFSALAIQIFYGGLRKPDRPPESTPMPSKFYRTYSPKRLIANIKRNFVKHIFDKIIYKDWDLLARDDMRNRLDQHYFEENNVLIEIASRELAKANS